jgi:hypothetical protein
MRFLHSAGSGSMPVEHFRYKMEAACLDKSVQLVFFQNPVNFKDWEIEDDWSIPPENETARAGITA